MYIWIRNNNLYFFGYFSIFLFVLFFIFNTSFGNISILNLLQINKNIDQLKYDLSTLQKAEEKLNSKIKLLNSKVLDSDYISELANKNLGLIKPNRVIIIVE